VPDSSRGADLAWDADDITTAGYHPSFNLAHHGDDDRTLRAAFAVAYRDRSTGRSHPCPPRVGFVVTHPHEGSFLRRNRTAGLTPDRNAVSLFGSVHGIESPRNP
jgi:hypothetical protein